jgi:hypothetical protein
MARNAAAADLVNLTGYFQLALRRPLERRGVLDPARKALGLVLPELGQRAIARLDFLYEPRI